MARATLRHSATSDRRRALLDVDELRRKAKSYMVLSRLPGEGGSQAEVAYQVLESLIASMDFPPGSVLNLDLLQDIVGLGRTPVREALKLLEADGVVTLRQRTGVTIPQIDVDRQLQILQVRRPLEQLASRLAAASTDREEAEPLSVLADELLAVGSSRDAQRMMRLGTATYHRLIALAGNEYLRRPLLSVYSLSRRYYFSRLNSGEMMVETTQLHHRRFRAVIERDEARAAEETDRLIDYFMNIARIDSRD